MKKRFLFLSMALTCAIGLAGCSVTSDRQGDSFADTDKTPKGASQVTKTLNQQFFAAHMLDPKDTTDMDNAKRGLIYKPSSVEIAKDDDTGSAWSLEKYIDLVNRNDSAPETVNPSLWRNFELHMEYGLYRVTDRVNTTPGSAGYDSELHVYQVRSYDLSNITFIRTPGNSANDGADDGWLVLDPLISRETARAALNLVNEQLLQRREIPQALPVRGVIYSHSHIDHFGGVRGLLNGQPESSLTVIAPAEFMEHAVSENVIAGNAMSRRAIYMYGSLTGVDEKKGVGAGLGLTTSSGEPTLIPPSDGYSISKTTPVGCSIDDNQSLRCGITAFDGLEMHFQMTPGTEAPAEMNTYFPHWNGLWMAENATNTMHNVLTLRGALVRDPLIWAKFMNETITRWGSEVKVKFQSHHTPLWNTAAGEGPIVANLEKQRDIYKYIHDQSVRLMNQGFIGEEISELITLPDNLEREWTTRGYYGTLKHNSRAVYQRYMGWYSGNPSDLNNLPPNKVARKYVEYIGADNLINKVKADIAAANEAVAADPQNYQKALEANEAYRFAAEVLKHLVFATHDVESDCPSGDKKCIPPRPTQAELLLADVYEQLAYQAESGPWRAVYLQAAFELRTPISLSMDGLNTTSTDITTNMTLPMLFDYAAVQLDPAKLKAAVEAHQPAVDFDSLVLNIKFKITAADVDAQMGGIYLLTIKNSVINYIPIPADKEADLDGRLDYDSFGDIALEMERSVLNSLLIDSSFEELVCVPPATNDCILVTGDDGELAIWQNAFTQPDFWFRIVTPRPDSL